MKVLNLLTSGSYGGIEVLCRDVGLYSRIHHCFTVCFEEGAILDDMLQKGIDAIDLTEYRRLSVKRFKRLCSIARDCDIIVVHHDDPFLEMYYLLLMALYPRKKYISMVHHCYDPKEERASYGTLKRIIKYVIVSTMFRKSDKLIFVSNSGYKSYLQRYKIDSEKVSVVYNGISKNKLDAGLLAQKESKLPLKFLYAGRLAKIKGVDILLEAINTIRDVEFTLCIVGDGAERTALEERVHQLNLSDKVSFVGFQQDVNPWLKDADVFIYPSRMEIFGISLVEAMAFQCICVGNNVGGIPEIISDGENGFLNKDNTVEGLASCLRKAAAVCLSKDARCEMMEQARLTAEKFNVAITISRLEEEVESLAGERDK